MMRGILLLGMISMASAAGTCEIDSGDTVSAALNSVLDIWAATKRCHGPILTQAPVKCEQDIASSIQSVTRMGSAIAHVVGDCGGSGLGEDGTCALAVNNMISSSAGLAAASGKIADKCFKTVPAQYDGDILQVPNILGKCVANTGDAMNSFFKASNAIQAAKSQCNSEGKKCTTSRLNVAAIVAHMGGFIAESIDDCSATHDIATATKGMDTRGVECAGTIMDGIGHLTTFSHLAMNIKDKCAASGGVPAAVPGAVPVLQPVAAQRLYGESDGANHEAAAGTPTLLALAAMVPISAVLSFVAGSHYAKSRRQTRTLPSPEELE